MRLAAVLVLLEEGVEAASEVTTGEPIASGPAAREPAMTSDAHFGQPSAFFVCHSIAWAPSVDEVAVTLAP
jgi:hypothetical protein